MQANQTSEKNFGDPVIQFQFNTFNLKKKMYLKHVEKISRSWNSIFRCFNLV